MRGNQSWSEEELELLQELVTAKSPEEEQRYGYWIGIAEQFEVARPPSKERMEMPALHGPRWDHHMAAKLRIPESSRARVLQWVKEWQGLAKRCQSIKTNQPLSSIHLHPSEHEEHKETDQPPALPPPKSSDPSPRPQPHLLAAQITSAIAALRVPTLPPIEMAQEVVHQNVEGEKMWDIFQAYATREQNLELAKDGLTEQLNRQNMNMHQMAVELDNSRQALYTVDRRSREWENAFRESQRMQHQLNYQLQEERERHKKTSLELDFEFKEHAKTEKHLERHYVTLNRLSEFLTMVQVASKEERSEVMDRLNKEPNMGTLILEIEDKKQCIGNLEEKLKAAKAEFEKAVATHHDAIRLKELEIAELEGVGSQVQCKPEVEHGVIEIIADLPDKKRSRADRKGSKRHHA